ncbi:MAG TPA: site-specific DNA-methyltransferase [Bryobacteraceae bacterium]|jgi:DNA modification methylase
MELDTVLHHDSLPMLAAMPDLSVDAVITDPPYPNGSGLFSDSLIDGIAGLYLAAKKARKHIVFFWTPLASPPLPPPGWFEVSRSVWAKPDARSAHAYELVICWSRDYRRRAHRVWTVPILDYRTLKDYKQHPTQKPVRLLRYLIEDYTQEGDTILDPFAGTGTTGVAAQQLKRHYLLIESNKEYADFAVARLAPKHPAENAPNDPATTEVPKEAPPELEHPSNQKPETEHPPKAIPPKQTPGKNKR